MQRSSSLNLRKSLGYLIIGLATTIVACSDRDSPVAPPSDPSFDLSSVRNQAARDRLLGSPTHAQCVLRIRKQNGEYRYKQQAIRLPRGSEHPQNDTRKFLYVSRATPGADPVRSFLCDIPATEAAISHMRNLVFRMNRNAQIAGPRAVRNGVVVQPQAAQTASAVTAQIRQGLTLQSQLFDGFDGCVDAGLCKLDPIVIIGEPSVEECDPYQELDWECVCDGPGVNPATVPDYCYAPPGEDPGADPGGSDGRESEEPAPPEDGAAPVESIDDDQGTNKYGCIGNVEYPQRSTSNPANAEVNATTVCAVALPELYVRVTLSVRKVVMRVGYWDEMAAGPPVALTFVREVRTTATGPCNPGQYRAESEHHATGLEGEYLGSPRRPWRIMTITCNGDGAL